MARWTRTRPRPEPTRQPYRLRAIGRIVRDPFHSTPGTHHQDVMLTAVLAGQGIYLRGGRRRTIEPGSLGLVFPGDDVGILMADPDDPYDHYYCRFGGDAAIEAARRVAAQHAEPFFPFEAITSAAETLEEIARLDDSFGARTGDEPLSPAEGMLAYLLAWLAPTKQASGRDLSGAAIQAYISDHLADPTDLDRIAEHFAVSKSHLCRVAKRELGRTVLDVAEEMKMDWARVLLQEANLPVKAVARRVGYPDPLYFSRVFRRRVGQSPTQWRSAAPGACP